MVNITTGLREWFLVAGVLFLAWLMLRSKKIFHKAMIARHLQGRHSLDPISIQILEKVFTVLVLAISSLFILQIFGLDIAPLLTFGGIGAAVLGLACRDVFANFFGGIMIYMTSPFSLQETIELPGKKILGTVEEIGWYFTTIRDLDKRSLYVPNSIFSTELLINHSRITHRWMNEKIRIRTGDGFKTQQILEAIRGLFREQKEIDHDQPLDIFLISIGPWGQEIEVKAYVFATQNEKFMEFKERMLLEIDKIIYQLNQKSTSEIR